MVESLERLREDGKRRFDALGYPTRRSEMWKYTDIRSIVGGEFGEPASDDISARHRDIIEREAAQGPVIVIQNGRLRSDLSSGIDGVDGLSVGQDFAGLASVLSQVPDAGDRPFAHLNAAHLQEATVISVAAGAVVEKAVRAFFINGGNSAFHARIAVSLGANASATLIETHLGNDEDGYFANPVSHIHVADGARLRHYRLQSEGARALHVATSLVAVGRDATYDSFALSLGAELARHEIEARFDGPGGDLKLSGAYIAKAGQHLDTTTRIDHLHPDCRSREVYHGAIADEGRGVFQGSIFVDPIAQRTDGHQLNRAILLGPGAEIDAKPQLEIYADDVKCSHGCTAGQLDQDAMFYLRSRGISEKAAKGLLIKAFLSEALDEISDETVREEFDALAQSVLDEVSHV
ncbi:MAG: Fe-S cluster assembly protein SufD [Pseudomonadota bacterium]